MSVEAFDRDRTIVIHAVTTAAREAVEPYFASRATATVQFAQDADITRCVERQEGELFDACLASWAFAQSPNAALLVRANVVGSKLALTWIPAEPLLASLRLETTAGVNVLAEKLRTFRLIELSSVEAGMADDLNPVLSELGLLRHETELLVRVRPLGTALTLDELPTVSASNTELVKFLGAAPGSHQLDAKMDGHVPEVVNFELANRLELTVTLRPDHRVARRVTGIAGLVMVAAGGAVFAYAAAETSNRPPPPRVGLGPIRWDYNPDPIFSVGDDPVGEGPVIVGVATGLAISGGAMAVLGLLDAEAPRPPWLDIGLSLLAGAAAVTVFELTN